MNKPTPGPWVLDSGDVLICGTGVCIAETDHSTILKRPTMEANAALIVAAVNSCFQISPDNPLAVAEALPEIVSELRAYHDREWMDGHEDLPAHKAGEYPDECGGCAALAKLEA